MPRRPSLIGSGGTGTSSRISTVYSTPSTSTRSSTRRSVVRIVTKARRKNRSLGLKRALPNFTSATPFPPIKGYKLTYEQDGYLTVGTAGVLGAQQKFILNGMYDVDITGGGHQPYGFDALSVAYQRYKINGVYIDLEFYNIQSINAVDISYLLSNPSNYTYDLAGKMPDAVGEKQMGETVYIQSVGTGRKVVRFYTPIHKIAGISKLQYKTDIDNYTSAVNDNPATKMGLHLAVADPNGNSTGGCRYKLKLTYYATLYQREIMAQS